MAILVIIIILIVFNCFRSSLRGLHLSLIDAGQLLFSTVVGFVLSPLLINQIMNLDFYYNLKLYLSSMLNYSAVILNINIADQTNYIENLNLPKSIYLLLIKNNTPEMYAVLNVVDLKDYIVAGIMFMVSRFIAFAFFSIIAYIIYYYIRIIFMPKIKLKSFGIMDKILGGFVGFLKGLYFSSLLLTLLLMYYSSIGFVDYQRLPKNSFIIYIFENYHYLLDLFLFVKFS